jgi:hypothetical protein
MSNRQVPIYSVMVKGTVRLVARDVHCLIALVCLSAWGTSGKSWQPREHASKVCIIETCRIRLVLFSMQNRTLHSYSAAINRTLTSVMLGLGTLKLPRCRKSVPCRFSALSQAYTCPDATGGCLCVCLPGRSWRSATAATTCSWWPMRALVSRWPTPSQRCRQTDDQRHLRSADRRTDGQRPSQRSRQADGRGVQRMVSPRSLVTRGSGGRGKMDGCSTCREVTRHASLHSH